jgi:hypothetical protein
MNADADEDAKMKLSIPLVVRIAAIFLLLAGAAAIVLAFRIVFSADGIGPVLTGLALAVNGVALWLLAWSPAVLGRPPTHWHPIILVFALAVAIELLKRAF